MATVTVVPTVEAGNVPPRVRLDVTDTGSPNITSTTVTRLDPDGRTVVVRTEAGGPLGLSTSGSDRIGLLYDYEMPLGQSVTYSTLESPTVVSAPVTVASSLVWLVHPGVPQISASLLVQTLGPRALAVQQGVFQPMGRSTPVVQTDGARKAPTWELTAVTWIESERAALFELLADAAPLLLNVPADKGWGVTHEYVAVGEVTEARINRIASAQMRVWTLPLTVVDRPAGGSSSDRTYADVLADNATYAALMVKYPTYFSLLAGP